MKSVSRDQSFHSNPNSIHHHSKTQASRSWLQHRTWLHINLLVTDAVGHFHGPTSVKEDICILHLVCSSLYWFPGTRANVASLSVHMHSYSSQWRVNNTAAFSNFMLHQSIPILAPASNSSSLSLWLPRMLSFLCPPTSSTSFFLSSNSHVSYLLPLHPLLCSPLVFPPVSLHS